jgi:hypothetical protein
MSAGISSDEQTVGSQLVSHCSPTIEIQGVVEQHASSAVNLMVLCSMYVMYETNTRMT